MTNAHQLCETDEAEATGSYDERRRIAALLTSVEREAQISQRRLASELGVALGLVNLYVKRCVRKGLIKVQQAPSRRYAYYLTPKGFAEKSRLTSDYLMWSLTFFRRARSECAEAMRAAAERGWRRVALAGGGDLAEIAALAAAEAGVEIVGVLDAQGQSLAGRPSAASLDDDALAAWRADAWLVTAIVDAQALHDALVARFGPERVSSIALLSLRAAA
jgi:DNA-binding MarR family transcriptional regulator